jgi:6-phosphogluconolactonase
MEKFFKTQILQNPEETVKQLALDLISYIREKLSEQEHIYIALSGGNTPQLLFNILKEIKPGQPCWSRVHFFWVDERCVPASSQESNFGNADRLLFSRIDIPRKNLHPIIGDNDPLEEMVRYAGEMKSYLPLRDEIPVFDIVLLGMGDDGHTASIFPGKEFLAEESSVCAVSVHPVSGQKRITITEKVINYGKEIVFLVTGSSKAQTLKLIFDNSKESSIFPAKNIAPPDGHLSWYLDKAAAELLIYPEN